MAFHLTLHPFRVEMRVSASAMLIPGHYLKRLKPISHPYGDVLLAKYRACARGHVLSFSLRGVEEGPCSGAKRSEAERSGVSGVKADGLPLDVISRRFKQ